MTEQGIVEAVQAVQQMPIAEQIKVDDLSLLQKNISAYKEQIDRLDKLVTAYGGTKKLNAAKEDFEKECAQIRKAREENKGRITVYGWDSWSTAKKTGAVAAWVTAILGLFFVSTFVMVAGCAIARGTFPETWKSLEKMNKA